MNQKVCMVALAVLFVESRPLAPQAPAGTWVEARGARVQAPAGWSHNDRLIAAGGPISLTNFGGAYLEGGLLPPGGVEIEVTSIPSPPNLVEYVRAEMNGAQAEPLRETTEGANSGIKATYVDSLAPDLALKTVVDYIPHGSSLYKFYESYWVGDRNEAAWNSMLAGVVREAQLR